MTKKEEIIQGKSDEKPEETSEEESELEELIDEDTLKEIAEEISRRSQPEFVDDSRFSEFMQLDTESSAPVLERVLGEQELGTRFFATGRRDENEKEGNEDIYATKNKSYIESPATESNQTNYDEITPQGQFSTSLSHFDISEAGRDLNPHLGSVGFSNPEINEARKKQKVFDEYKVKTERTDQSRTTHSTFEHQRDKKYKPRTL